MSKVFDLQALILILTSEYLSIDSEKALYTKFSSGYCQAFPDLIEGEDFNLLDSAPIPICEFARALHCRSCQEVDYTLPSYGYCVGRPALRRRSIISALKCTP